MTPTSQANLLHLGTQGWVKLQREHLMAGEACTPKSHYHLKLITVLYHWSLGREARWIMTEEVRG